MRDNQAKVYRQLTEFSGGMCGYSRNTMTVVPKNIQKVIIENVSQVVIDSINNRINIYREIINLVVDIKALPLHF